MADAQRAGEDLDAFEAFGAAAACLGNVGPGVRLRGPVRLLRAVQRSVDLDLHRADVARPGRDHSCRRRPDPRLLALLRERTHGLRHVRSRRLCQRRVRRRSRRRRSRSSTTASSTATASSRACACSTAGSSARDDHMARIARSARTIGLTLPVDADELIDIIGEVVRRSDLRDAHVRPIITRGFGGPGIDPRLCPDAEPDRVRLSVPAVPGRATRSSSSRARSCARRRARSGAHVKSLNYLDAIVAKQQAGELGMHDAVMLDSLGAVAECTGANLFIVVGDDAGHADDARRAARDHAPDGARDRRRAGDRGGRARRLADGAALRRRRVRVRLGRRHRADRLLRRAPGGAARASADRAHPGRPTAPAPSHADYRTELYIGVS